MKTNLIKPFGLLLALVMTHAWCAPLHDESLQKTLQRLISIQQATLWGDPLPLRAQAGDSQVLRLLERTALQRMRFEVQESSDTARRCIAWPQRGDLDTRLVQLVCRAYLAGNAYIMGDMRNWAQELLGYQADYQELKKAIPAIGTSPFANIVSMNSSQILRDIAKDWPAGQMSITGPSSPDELKLFSFSEVSITHQRTGILFYAYPTFAGKSNGHSFFLRWDTGANILAIPQEVADQLHLQYVGGVIGVRSLDGTLGQARYAFVKELTVGHRVLHNLPAVVLLGAVQSYFALGLQDMLKLGNFVLDSRQKRLLFGARMPDVRPVDVYMASGLAGFPGLEVSARMGGRNIQVFLDTGNSEAYGLDVYGASITAVIGHGQFGGFSVGTKSFYEKFKSVLSDRPIVKQRIVNSFVAPHYSRVIDLTNQKLKIGNQTIVIKKLKVFPDFDASYDISLGMADLKAFSKIGVDFSHHHLYLEK